MNVIEIVIAVFLILIIVITMVTEPLLSLQYFKAVGKSVGVIIVKIKDTIKDWNGDKQNSESTEVK